MKDTTKKIIVKVGAFLFAVAIIVAVSILSRNTMLKASEEEAAVAAVQEKADAAPEVPEKKDEPKKEVPEEKPVEEKPVDKEEKETAVEEIPISEIEEEAAEEEFDVRKAYKEYKLLNESNQQKYLNSLSSENRSKLLKYIEKMETEPETESEEVINEELENAPEAAEEPAAENNGEETEEAAAKEDEKPAEESKKKIDYSKLKVSFTSDHTGKKTQAGETINLKAKLEGFDGLDYTVYWEYSDDGGKTYKIDGKGMTHSVVASEENSGWIWRVNVLLNK